MTLYAILSAVHSLRILIPFYGINFNNRLLNVIIYYLSGVNLDIIWNNGFM